MAVQDEAQEAKLDAAIALLPPAQAIPTTPGAPNYTMRTRLDGRDFVLRFLWNQREERWYFDIYSDGDELLVAGIKVVCNWPLLRYYQYDDRLPPGEMIATDLTGDASPPGLYDLGIDKRVQLFYHPTTEL